MNKIFINTAVTFGLDNYLKKIANEPVDNAHIYELRIIELLVSIFGEINIINPYKLENEKEFRNNLTIYGTKEQEINLLFYYLNKYEKWLGSTNTVKNNFVDKIEELIIRFIELKNYRNKISTNEINYYDDYFFENMPDLKRIHEIISENPNYIHCLWQKRKTIIENSKKINFSIVKPKFLSEEKYKQFGVSLKEVQQLSNIRIMELNKKIEEESTVDSSGGRIKNKPLQLVLTSGNGFVDTLVLLSVMATEIMIGLLIAFTIARG